MVGQGDLGGEVVTLAGVAAMAGVTRPAVSNWRRRHKDDFPQPVKETGTASSFLQSEVEAWLRKHGKRYTQPGAEQQVWNALDAVLGATTVDAALDAGFVLVGALAVGDATGSLPRESQGSRVLAASDDVFVSKLKALLRDVADVAHPQLLAFDDSKLVAVVPFLRNLVQLVDRYGLPDVFEALVSAVRRTSRAYDFATPRVVADCLVQLAQPSEGILYDPACGTGGLLLAAAQAGTLGLTLVGHDVNEHAWKVATLRMLVHGFPASVVQRDSLTIGPDAHGVADLVVTAPPLGARLPAGVNYEQSPWFADLPPSRTAAAWVLHAVASLRSPEGRAVVLAPPSLAFQGGTVGASRRRLVELGCVHAVITLPRGLYRSTTIPVAIWVLGQPGTSPEEILLVDARGVGEPIGSRTELQPDDVAAIASCYRLWSSGRLPDDHPLPHYRASVEEVLAGGLNLSPDRWITGGSGHARADELDTRIGDAIAKWATVKESTLTSNLVPLLSTSEHASPDEGSSQGQATFGKLRSLLMAASEEAPKHTIGDLCDWGRMSLLRGRRVQGNEIGDGNVPLVQARDIKDDWTFTPSTSVDPAQFDPPIPVSHPGDIFVVTSGDVRVAVDQDGGVAPAAPVHILRCRQEWMDPLVMAAMLTATISTGAYDSGTVVKHRDLFHVEVPVPDQATNRRMAAVVAELAKERKKARDLVAATDELFSSVIEGFASGRLTVATPEVER